MPARIHRFQSKREHLSAEKAAAVRQAVADLAEDPQLPDELITKLFAVIDTAAANREGRAFVLMGPTDNAAVVEWLSANSKRRSEAVRLWALLFTTLRWDTGQIGLTRAEIAEKLGMDVGNVSRVMTELVGIGAISRHYRGRTVQYQMNPNCGTRLGGQTRMEALEAAGQLRLVD